MPSRATRTKTPGAEGKGAESQPATRTYSREEILEFLEADELDPEMRRKIERLLAA
jgi:hypothetical protein